MLPPTRYSRNSRNSRPQSPGGQHRPDPQLSPWYSSGADAAPQAEAPAAASQQDAVAQALCLPSSLQQGGKEGGSRPTISLTVAAGCNTAAAAAAAQPALTEDTTAQQPPSPVRGSQTAPNTTAPATAPATPAPGPKLHPNLHPKYAAMVAAALEAEAAVLCSPRPQRCPTSPAKAPGSPEPSAGWHAGCRLPRTPSALSKTGSGASAASSTSTPRRPCNPSGLSGRTLQARIEQVQRSSSPGAALAEVVRATLAEQDALLLQQVTEQVTAHLSRLSRRSAQGPSRSTPRGAAMLTRRPADCVEVGMLAFMGESCGHGSCV